MTLSCEQQYELQQRLSDTIQICHSVHGHYYGRFQTSSCAVATLRIFFAITVFPLRLYCANTRHKRGYCNRWVDVAANEQICGSKRRLLLPWRDAALQFPRDDDFEFQTSHCYSSSSGMHIWIARNR